MPGRSRWRTVRRCAGRPTHLASGSDDDHCDTFLGLTLILALTPTIMDRVYSGLRSGGRPADVARGQDAPAVLSGSDPALPYRARPRGITSARSSATVTSQPVVTRISSTAAAYVSADDA